MSCPWLGKEIYSNKSRRLFLLWTEIAATYYAFPHKNFAWHYSFINMQFLQKNSGSHRDSSVFNRRIQLASVFVRYPLD
jgi:hypothetical protein